MNEIDSLPQELKKNYKTLKEISYDKTNKQYMTDSNILAYDFDEVKNEYVKMKLANIKEKPKSNDALYFSKNGKWIFIEFKNKSIDDTINFQINRKIHDSLFIMFDLMYNYSGNAFKSCISFTRENMDYILVYKTYDSNKPTRLTQKGLERQKIELKDSDSRDVLKRTIARRGGENIIFFGLDQFKDYLFRNVYTYTKEEFKRNFIDKIDEI